MSKMLTVSIADSVYEQIEILRKKKKINRSELCDDLLRRGLKNESPQ